MKTPVVESFFVVPFFFLYFRCDLCYEFLGSNLDPRNFGPRALHFMQEGKFA